MLVIQRFCAVSMIALILLAFCCCPVIAAELDVHVANEGSNLDELKEKIKKGFEKFKEGNYTQDIKVNTDSTVHHIVNTLSYNNQKGELEVRQVVDESLSVPHEKVTNLRNTLSSNTVITLFKNGRKIIEGTCNLYGKIDSAIEISQLSVLTFNEITGENENEFSIDSVGNALIYNTDRGFWTLVRHTHLTSDEVDELILLADILVSATLMVLFGLLGCGGGSIVGLAVSITVSTMLTAIINDKRNADGSLDMWETLHDFRDCTDKDVAPSISDWYGKTNFENTLWWKVYQNAKLKGKKWMGYEILFGNFTPKGGAKYLGSPDSMVNAPVYVASK